MRYNSFYYCVEVQRSNSFEESHKGKRRLEGNDGPRERFRRPQLGADEVTQSQ